MAIPPLVDLTRESLFESAQRNPLRVRQGVFRQPSSLPAKPNLDKLPDSSSNLQSIQSTKRKHDEYDTPLRKTVWNQTPRSNASTDMDEIESELIDLTIDDHSLGRCTVESKVKKQRVHTGQGNNLRRSGQASTFDRQHPQAITIIHDAIDDDCTFLFECALTENQIEESLAALTYRPTQSQRRLAALNQPRSHKREIQHVKVAGILYHAGTNVELTDGTFMRTEKVWIDEDGTVSLTGRHLVRTGSLGCLIPERTNELVWTGETTMHNASLSDTPEHKGVLASQVVKHRNISFTNRRYPTTSFEDCKDFTDHGLQEAQSTGPLYCRWKHVKVLTSKNKIDQECISQLLVREADPERKIDPPVLRFLWRGKTNLGGSSNTTHESATIYEGRSSHQFHKQNRQRYTFGDAFCGAGGISRGAVDAGLCIKWAFDKDSPTMESYRSNPDFVREGATCCDQAADEFLCYNCSTFLRVDICHGSPPCQPYSPAHTIDSPIKDEANQAALCSVHPLLDKCKPRVFTLEQTAGLIQRQKHREWFASLINNITGLGYSVRWKVLNCKDFGVPSERHRLILIAAGPGEKLPPFPKPTHGPGLRPFRTINDWISNMPDGTSHHVEKWYSSAKLPHERDFAKTLTTNGGQGNWHPSGERDYTNRELARLQTLPWRHEFAGNNHGAIRRQIGNMVPALMGKALFKVVIQSLQEADEEESGMIRTGNVDT